RRHGAAALPRDIPVLRGGGAALVPALSAKRRQLSGPALQHRVVLLPHAHGGPAVRSGGGGVRLDGRRLPHLPQPPRSCRGAAAPRAAAATEAAHPPEARLDFRVSVRGLRDRGLPSASAYPRTHCGVSATAAPAARHGACPASGWRRLWRETVTARGAAAPFLPRAARARS